MSNEFIVSFKNWCDEVLEIYNLSNLRDLKDNIEMQQWENKLRAFQLMLEHKNADQIPSSEIVEQANQLYKQLEYFINRVHPSNSVPIGKHTLPPLPYQYDALEPYISSEIMRLHHTKHHQSYVEGLNKAERKMKEARSLNQYDLIKHWEREAAFNGAGHYLHTTFWNIMSPKGGGQPSGMLMKEIRQVFESFDKFKKHFSEAANNVEGVGWALLVWSPRSKRLEILQAEKHQNLSQWDVIPILVLDVWEHAYYLQYKNDRKKYVENWWNIVNWREVERHFHAAQQLRWT